MPSLENERFYVYIYSVYMVMTFLYGSDDDSAALGGLSIYWGWKLRTRHIFMRDIYSLFRLRLRNLTVAEILYTIIAQSV